ncbi:helix-turn-helix transcriptional regulator [Arthrobacter sp. 35W]|uniref:helix-turn-helix transcriptional regulator n=1 Tax=Arthrobacter sp. 35W TaxID=1132441 RepID=UPI000402FBE9|nr:helix-turn-helix domain-containing protein [Arthrobacter sp. 35W]
MAHAHEADRLASVAALGDPVRRALFTLVRASGEPLSREDCAVALDLPRSTALAQLDRLVESGLLSVEYRKLGPRTGPGSGRPAKLYKAAVTEVSASVPERHYDLAAALLARAVERSMATGAPVAESLGEVAYFEGVERGEREGSMEAVLDATGYAPQDDGDGGFVLANCPFHRLAREHTEVVCSLNGALLTGALAGCADPGLRVVPDPDGPYCCARIQRT